MPPSTFRGELVSRVITLDAHPSFSPAGFNRQQVNMACVPTSTPDDLHHHPRDRLSQIVAPIYGLCNETGAANTPEFSCVGLTLCRVHNPQSTT